MLIILNLKNQALKNKSKWANDGNIRPKKGELKWRQKKGNFKLNYVRRNLIELLFFLRWQWPGKEKPRNDDTKWYDLYLFIYLFIYYTCVWSKSEET